MSSWCDGMYRCSISFVCDFEDLEVMGYWCWGFNDLSLACMNVWIIVNIPPLDGCVWQKVFYGY